MVIFVVILLVESNKSYIFATDNNKKQKSYE